jgi:polysaccharide export outer membrane protein|uniref:Soluble ligand binding domain-containing protein n=1 Tax=candidate division WOR-3 bacterium TaxID=2052148 RepID=A0A7V3RG92_UNCW3
MFFLLLLAISPHIYLIPNDAVEIDIWHQPNLSGKYLVEADTSLNIPLLGKLSIKNIPADSLERMLIDEFHKYYGDVFLNINIYYQINVFGEVKLPGKYYLKSSENLTNLLAMAGGPTSSGNLGKIRILNLGKERVVNLEKILKSGKRVEDLNLMPGDIVIVPRRLVPALQEWSVLFTIGTLILQIIYYARG